MQGVKVVISVKCVYLCCVQSEKPVLNLTPVVVGTLRDRSCSSELIG